MNLTIGIEKIQRKKIEEFIDYDGYPLYENIFSIKDENNITWKPDGFAYKVVNYKIRGEVEGDQTMSPYLMIYEEHIDDYMDLIKKKGKE